jgi:hypothetical protein
MSICASRDWDFFSFCSLDLGPASLHIQPGTLEVTYLDDAGTIMGFAECLVWLRGG